MHNWPSSSTPKDPTRTSTPPAPAPHKPLPSLTVHPASHSAHYHSLFRLLLGFSFLADRATSRMSLSVDGADWLRLGRCKRVVVISADNATSDELMPYLGTGFLALTAASIAPT